MSLYLSCKNNKPKWIRPITIDGHGQVPSHLVSHIELLQVVQIEVSRHVPLGYQSENILFDPQSLCVLGKIKLNEKFLDLQDKNSKILQTLKSEKNLQKPDGYTIDNNNLKHQTLEILDRIGEKIRLNEPFAGLLANISRD